MAVRIIEVAFVVALCRFPLLIPGGLSAREKVIEAGEEDVISVLATDVISCGLIFALARLLALVVAEFIDGDCMTAGGAGEVGSGWSGPGDH